ncbi:response regulator transcription factor [Pedobacter sp. Hv1]|uniref:response regulator transcription factor n=1 Tax=Pedobacter sp. Hv1 TaxID=1740090 RepID=UPI0006D8C397|nr:response regulator transcription factor [Pedobacter sp. Hv1]KQC00327.1 two-component system response regulator [Pedobacter sp. Hv1]
MSDLKILFVEDEPALAEIVKESLESKGFIVFHVTTIAEGLHTHVSNKFDMLILDVMLPDGDGFSLLKKIRLKDLTTPALFLTSKSLAADVVMGFESGANDYLKKPFSMEELIIRIRSLLGIVSTRPINDLKKTGLFAIGEYVFHYPEGILVYKGAKKQLTFREAEILYMLQIRHEQMVLRQELLHAHWGNDDYFSGRSLDVFITKLRKYLKQDPSIAILNFRGQGYKLIF